MHEFAIRRRCAATDLAHPLPAICGARLLSRPLRPPARTGLPRHSPPRVPTQGHFEPPDLFLAHVESTCVAGASRARNTMANFEAAYAQTMKAEGGYVNDPQDPGGETYKGVARKFNSKWDGWIDIDMAKREPNFPANLDANAPLQEKIKRFYEVNYWDRVRGDEISDQNIAESIFDFAVNAGVITSSKLAQITVGAEPDGTIGPQTLQQLNTQDPRTFLALFALNKIARYLSICEKRSESKKFFYGWVKRTVEAL